MNKIKYLIGIDEVGRGPLAGPVTVCAFCVPKASKLKYSKNLFKDFKDSKKLSPSRREELSKIAILRPRYIAMIINMLPDTEEEVENLFSKERTNLKKEEVKQIVDVVNKYK